MIGLIAGSAVAAAIFYLDFRIKNKVERDYREDTCIRKGGGKILLQKFHNPGLMLGVGSGRKKMAAALSLLMTFAAFLLFLVSFGKKGNQLLHFGLPLLLGGAFSNAYDRLKRGYVVDYVSFDIGSKRLKNIVFNISDFFIMIGALITALGLSERDPLA